MPIKPENSPAPYAEPLADFLLPAEVAAVESLRHSFGVDAARTYQFWESLVARLTGGNVTAHKCGWDIELTTPFRTIRIEVKFSNEFECRFRTGVRRVFKFAAPKGNGALKLADAFVLIGFDSQREVNAWVVPHAAMPRCKSVTLNPPRYQVGPSKSRGIDRFLCPPSQILPEVMRASRYPANAAKTRKARKAVGDLFERFAP